MRRAFASLNCGMRGIESGGLSRRNGFVFKRRIRKRAFNRIGHDFPTAILTVVRSTRRINPECAEPCEVS